MSPHHAGSENIVHTLTLISMMNRSAIALAIAALSLPSITSAAAPGPDTVTLYGLVDVGYLHTKVKGRESVSGLSSGNQAASRWGIRGSHDLGNGQRVNFQLENGFDITTGQASQGGRLFGRLAWAGLSGHWGELRAGRQTLAATDYTALFSAFGSGFKLAGGGQAINATTTPRANSTLKYITPDLAGLQAQLSYSFNAGLAQNTDSTGTADTRDRSDRVFSAAARYKQARWQVIAFYEGSTLGDATTSGGTHIDVTPRGYGLGGTLDVGPVKVFAGFAQHKDAYINGTPSNNAGQAATFRGGKVNGYSVGLRTNVGTGEFIAQFQLSDPNGSVVRNGQQARDQKVYSVGYTYPLSKRTNVYGFASYLDGAWFDTVSNGTTVSASDWSTRQLAVGLLHRF